jgi:hypothetical protein
LCPCSSRSRDAGAGFARRLSRNPTASMRPTIFRGQGCVSVERLKPCPNRLVKNCARPEAGCPTALRRSCWPDEPAHLPSSGSSMMQESSEHLSHCCR